MSLLEARWVVRVRGWLATWRFAVGVAYFVLACVVVALWVNFGRTSSEVSARHATIQANAEAQYQGCLKSIPLAKKLNQFIHGVQTEHLLQAETAREALKLTPPGDPFYMLRERNVKRTHQALVDVQVVTPFHVSTKKECLALKRRLSESR